MAIYNGFDTESRERVYSGNPNDFENDRQFGRELMRSRSGQRFLDEFEFDSARDLPLLLDTARLLNREPAHITLSMCEHAIEVLMDRAPAADRWSPGKLKRKAPEPAPIAEPEAPVHRGQQMWREHAEFMEHGGKDGGMPSGDEVRHHARESKSFRAYLQQGYEARMSGEIGGAGVVLNAPLASSDGKPSPELLAWVEEYRTTPMNVVRQRMRCDYNPAGWQAYSRNFSRAVELGLI